MACHHSPLAMPNRRSGKQCLPSPAATDYVVSSVNTGWPLILSLPLMVASLSILRSKSRPVTKAVNSQKPGVALPGSEIEDAGRVIVHCPEARASKSVWRDCY